MTDRLDAIAAGLRDGRYDCRVPGDTDDVRWLVGEVRRLRGELSAAEYHRDGARATIEQLERDLAALRERHAADVEAAFKDGWLERGLLPDCGMPPLHSRDAAWLQSDARRKCAALTII